MLFTISGRQSFSLEITTYYISNHIQLNLIKIIFVFLCFENSIQLVQESYTKICEIEVKF